MTTPIRLTAVATAVALVFLAGPGQASALGSRPVRGRLATRPSSGPAGSRSRTGPR
jgi:hypothetical protein